MHPLVAVAAIVLLTGCRPPEPSAHPAPLLTSLPQVLIDTSTRFGVVIERSAPDSTAWRLLLVAEATYPSRDSVLRAFGGTAAERRALERETGLWWVSSFDGTRIPFAITASAVEYYLSRSQELRGNQRFISLSRLQYRATISFHADFALDGIRYSNAYVAELRLGWSQYCGSLCALYVTKQRTVVLTPSGVVLRVKGDGVEPVLVS